MYVCVCVCVCVRAFSPGIYGEYKNIKVSDSITVIAVLDLIRYRPLWGNFLEMCVCVCVCKCVGERGRGREGDSYPAGKPTI